MLERLAGNDALKAELGTALRGGRLPHAVLLVGSRAAARALLRAVLLPITCTLPAAPRRGRAEKEDTECLVLQGEGASGQIPVKGARGAGGDPALGAVHRRGGPRAVHLRRAESERVIRQRDAEDHRGAARGVLFLLTATSAATVLPTIRSRCAAYTIAPVPAADCAARLKAERLPAKAAEELAFLYEGTSAPR